MMKTKTAIEIFLFINPLESTSYNMEKIVSEFSKEREEKVHIRFVPLLNFNTVSKHLSDNRIKGASLTLRNEIYSKTYKMSLAFEAAMMQGKKLGRTFLMSLQDAILVKKFPLTKELIQNTAINCGLDMEMFNEDLHSDFAKEDFLSDQNLAREMGVQNTPSCVIYNSKEDSYGCLIDTHFTKRILHGVCNMDINDSHTIQDIQQKYNFEFI